MQNIILRKKKRMNHIKHVRHKQTTFVLKEIFFLPHWENIKLN